MIKWEVWVRVLKFQGEDGQRGAAFFINHQDSYVLVTAKHLTSGERDESVVLSHDAPGAEQGVERLTLTRVGDLDAPGDVAAYAFPGIASHLTTVDVPLSSDGFIYTQDCYIMGYPYLRASTTMDQAMEFPVVKRGIIAGTSQLDGTSMILVDVIANPGFSGGPLVFENQGTGQLQFAGVVSRAMAGPMTPGQPEPWPPAGLSYVTDAGAVRRLLE